MKKILIIEDDAVLRENTAELLELSDFNVVTAPNGKIGLELALEENPDIVVCDIMMPELDGYGVLNGLSKNDITKYIPFIFLSAKTERKEVRKGMNLGADDYITKPFSEDELISAIESRLAKASILNDERNRTIPQEESLQEEIRTLNDLKNFFDDNGEIFKFNKDEVIYEEGNNSNNIYLVLKGVVKCYKLDQKGKELITALYKEDDLFGYSSFTQNIPYQETAKAIKTLELVGVSKTTLKNVLTNNHTLTLELLELLNDNITEIKDQLLQMAYSSVNKKTAITILKFAEKLNTKPDESIKICRNDLASVAGIATETLIRTISSFKKQGLIDIEGRNIKILDIQKLKSMY
jgi:DNA-binding response OmpR family regulator